MYVWWLRDTTLHSRNNSRLFQWDRDFDYNHLVFEDSRCKGHSIGLKFLFDQDAVVFKLLFHDYIERGERVREIGNTKRHRNFAYG